MKYTLLLILCACGVAPKQSEQNSCLKISSDSSGTIWDCPYAENVTCEYLFSVNGKVELIKCWEGTKPKEKKSVQW